MHTWLNHIGSKRGVSVSIVLFSFQKEYSQNISIPFSLKCKASKWNTNEENISKRIINVVTAG